MARCLHCGHDDAPRDPLPLHRDLKKPIYQCVIDLLRQGLSNQEMAARLGLKSSTMNMRLSRIYDRTGLRDRSELLLYLLGGA